MFYSLKCLKPLSRNDFIIAGGGNDRVPEATVALAGGVTLTLSEGQTEGPFALVNTADLSVNMNVTLTASYTCDGQTVVSANSETITLVDAGAPTGTESDANAIDGGEGGSVLPAWMAFDAQTRTLTTAAHEAERGLHTRTRRVTRRQCVAIASIAHYPVFTWARWRFHLTNERYACDSRYRKHARA